MTRAEAERVIQRLAEFDTEYGWRPETRAQAVKKLVGWHEEAKDYVRDRVRDGRQAWFKSIIDAFDELGPRGADAAYLRAIYQHNPPEAPPPAHDAAALVRSILEQRVGPNHDTRCHEGCQGWDVFDTNSERGMEIEVCDECNIYAEEDGLPTITDADAALLPEAQARLREVLGHEWNQNPAPEPDEAAVEKYREFHRFDPKKIVACPRLVIPSRLRRAGDAKHVMYRSNKVDPATMQKPRGTFDYIHEHDAGVRTYVPDGELDTDVPEKFRLDPATSPSLVMLGKCLGFAFTDPDGELVEAEGRAPLPDLLCTPDGKCLLVVQSGKQVLAMMWGGALGVFARGIDG